MTEITSFHEQLSYDLAYLLSQSKYRHLIKDICVFEIDNNCKCAIITNFNDKIFLPTGLSNTVLKMSDLNKIFNINIKNTEQKHYSPKNLPIFRTTDQLRHILSIYKTTYHYVTEELMTNMEDCFRNEFVNLPIEKIYQISQNINLSIKEFAFKYNEKVYSFNNTIFSILPKYSNIESTSTYHFLSKLLEFDAELDKFNKSQIFNETFKDFQIIKLLKEYWDIFFNNELYLNSKNEYQIVNANFEDIKILTKNESKKYFKTTLPIFEIK